MTDSNATDTMRGRAGASRRKLWLLVNARRPVAVVAVVGLSFLGLAALGVILPGTAERLAAGDPVETAFQAFIGATITGVTLVLTLNQLVLSQEFGAIGDQRQRMDGAMSFRSDVADLLEDPIAPSDPAAFLTAILTTAADRAGEIDEAVTDGDSDGVSTLVNDVRGSAETVKTQLDGARFGSFEVISGALDFEYSSLLYRTRRLRTEGDLPPSADEAAAELETALELFGPAREHFKTLYFQWELVELSRTVLAAALPALLVAVSMVLYYDVSSLQWMVLGIPAAVLVVSAAVAVAVTPFVVLLVYILRIATVTKQTLSVGPFVLRPRNGER